MGCLGKEKKKATMHGVMSIVRVADRGSMCMCMV